MNSLTQRKIKAFREKILTFYEANGKAFPFRRTTDPYKITVAEIMLQQTQVERVLPVYSAWVKKWPGWRQLSRATPKELLTAWSGLGYNRRAIHLGKIAQIVVAKYKGRLPDDPRLLRTLPGIGPYTTNAILIFAFNKPLVAIDTNIRKVIMHELDLPAQTSLSEIEEIVRKLLPPGRSRDWHNALMDYSRMALPRRIEKLPPLSRQSRYDGSVRQIRGVIVRQLTIKSRVSLKHVASLLHRSEEDIRKAAQGLQKEGIVRVGDIYIALS